MFQMSQVRLLATLCAFFAGDLSAWAQTDLPFYNGKEIRLMVGYASGYIGWQISIQRSAYWLFETTLAWVRSMI
jgi:hypothetical protein